MLNDGLISSVKFMRISSVKFMRKKGLGIKRIANELGIGVGTVYKAIEA